MSDPRHRLRLTDAPMLTLGSLLEMLREEGRLLLDVLDDPKAEASEEYGRKRCRHVLTLAEAASELYDTIEGHLHILGDELET